ncbi:hypothetical protein NE237_020080 [Protea cynaroides]|uniref:Uncharacterized protein n=1 Tax=Protea cynaroides TaxID=273540 RepID=A0A9Q0K338_9MAGN|nr:hypothetical protein NE237_020080 [Protea cynaroides]
MHGRHCTPFHTYVKHSLLDYANHYSAAYNNKHVFVNHYYDPIISPLNFDVGLEPYLLLLKDHPLAIAELSYMDAVGFESENPENKRFQFNRNCFTRLSMTVGPVEESQEKGTLFHLQKFKDVRSSEFAMDNDVDSRFTEKTTKRQPTPTHSDVVDGRFSCLKQQEDDRERERSSETKSGEKEEYWMKNIEIVHHQILKIREEDSHLGQEIREGLSTKEKLAVLQLTSQMDSFILSRPILPSSPLSGRTAIKMLH